MAKAGKDVDTASFDDLVFSSDFPTLRVKYTGLATAVPYSGDFSSVYNRAIVTYPTPFAAPPIVFAAGWISATESDQKVTSFTNPYAPGGFSYQVPWYTVNSMEDRFELYVLARIGDGTTPIGDYTGIYRTLTYRYYVFDSLIESDSP